MGRMPTPQQAGRPRYEYRSSLYFAIFNKTLPARHASSCIRSGFRLVDASFGARQRIESTRDGKRKCRSRTIIRCGPKTSLMSLDDGVADGQPDSHAVTFCCVERIK